MGWGEWFRKSLQDGDSPSSSRWLTAGNTIVSWVWITYFVIKHGGQIPDAVTMAGLASFCTAPYLVNRATVAYENKTTDTAPK